MNELVFDQKENIYYKNPEERTWILDQRLLQNNSIKKYEKSSVYKWREYLNDYLFNSRGALSEEIFGSPDCRSEKRKFPLNLDTFITSDWHNIEKWKKKILFKMHVFLSAHPLIKSKRISVQFIGSIGSKDPIPYSDLDCLIILPSLDNWDLNNIVELKKLYRVVNYYAYMFDPLQHHGAFVLTETELINEFPPFYPMNLMDKAWGYGRDHYFSSSYNIQNKGCMNFINNNQFLRRMNYQQELPNSLYNLKYILSSIFLMPVYYYNAKNKFYCKKNSIEKIIKSEDTIGNNLNWISKFRRNWQSSSFPIFKKMILKAGINFFPIEDLDLFNRRIEYHLRSGKNKPLLLKATEIINRGNIISDILLNKLVHNS
jgi:hypothetical protein